MVLAAVVFFLSSPVYSLPEYDSSKQSDYSCVVLDVLRIREKKNGSSSEIYMKVLSGKREYFVYAWPRWYLGSMGNLRKGDRVGVFGSLTGKFRGRPLIPAKVFEKNGASVWLRNYDGQPFWEMKDGGPVLVPEARGQRAVWSRGDGWEKMRQTFWFRT